MSLKSLSINELIESTHSALKISRDAEVVVLRHFQEIEDRRLWVGVGSLYGYLTETFKLTGDQIYPRLQAMRLMRSVPQVEKKLEDGALSVTNALKVQQVFRAEEKKRAVSVEEMLEVLESLSHASTKEAEKFLIEKYPESKQPIEKVKPIAKNQNLLQFYVDDETLKEIEELKARYSHQMPSGKMEDLMKILIQKAKHQPTPKPRKQIIAKTRSRHIPAEVKRKMEKTRHLGCGHIDPETGRHCGTKHFLQMDHVHEYTLGGAHESHNLQWRCGFHNRLRFETRSGASTANTKIYRRGVKDQKVSIELMK